MLALLHYDPETGLISNKVARRGARCGDAAGSINGMGYSRVYFKRKHYYAHRVAWALFYGEQPPDYIDHIDGNGLNNSIANLRKAEQRQNLGNQKVRTDNTTGYKGVTLFKRTGKYIARAAGKHLGYFATPEEAHAAYCKAADAEFGEYARVA